MILRNIELGFNILSEKIESGFNTAFWNSVSSIKYWALPKFKILWLLYYKPPAISNPIWEGVQNIIATIYWTFPLISLLLDRGFIIMMTAKYWTTSPDFHCNWRKGFKILWALNIESFFLIFIGEGVQILLLIY